MNSALLLLLLAVLASLAAAQDTQDASVDTANSDTEKSDEKNLTDTGDAVNEDKLDAAAGLLDGTPDNSTVVDDDTGSNATIAASEHAPTSVEDPHITIERDGAKQISELEVDGRIYKIVVEPASEADDSGKTKNATDPETVTKKTPEDNSDSSTVTASGSTTQKTPAVEVTTEESSGEDESSTKSTKAPQVEVTTKENGNDVESSTNSTNATTVEETTQKNGSEEETSTNSTVRNSEPTKAPASENVDDELPKKNNRRKRDAGSAVVDPIITVERDGAKETHTLDIDGVLYQIVIEPKFVDDPNAEKTQDDGNDNKDDIVKGNKQTEPSGNGTVTTQKNFPTPPELPLEGGSDKDSTGAPIAGKDGDNITKSTVAA